MLIEGLKETLQRTRLYDKFSYSKLHYWTLKYRNPHYIKLLENDLAFYRRALGSSLKLVFDVGANIGDKTWVFRQLAEKVVCVEPTKNCFATLQTRYGKDKSIALENLALGDQEGQATFFMDGEGSYYNTLSEKQKMWLQRTRKMAHLQETTISVSTLDKLISKHGVPDFLKIDVEGYEYAVMQGLSYRIPVISFEANLPHFRAETLKILARFKGQPLNQYNLLWNNDFLFPDYQSYDRIIAILSEDKVATYDVFVYTHLTS